MTDTKKTAPIDKVLAYAYVHSNGGSDYVPTSHRDLGEEPTVDKVRTSLFEDLASLTPDEQIYYGDKEIEAAELLKQPQKLAEIKVSALGIRAGTYAEQMQRILINGHAVAGRDLSVLSSLVSQYARDVERRHLEANLPKSVQGYLGHVGQRLHDLKITVKTVRYRDSRFGETTWMVGIAASGHTVVWKASKRLDISPGDTIVLSGATVKELKQYNGGYETVLKNATIA